MFQTVVLSAKHKKSVSPRRRLNDLSTRTLAKHCANLSFEELPKAVQERTKEMILDLLGVAIYGTTLKSSKIMLEYVKNLGGKEESTLLGDLRKASAPDAGLANGTSAHGPELDDTEHKGPIHPGASAIPAALAVSEKLHVDGRRFMTAVVGGYDVAVRVAIAVQGRSRAHYGRGFHPSATCGAFGATAAAGIALGLKEDQMSNAFGITGSQTAGLWEFMSDGSWTKRFGVGRATQNGVMAASLAELGFTGPGTILEGKCGFLRAYSDDVDLFALTRGLGEEFSIMETGIKAHACCRYIQSAIDATLQIARSCKIEASDVEEIVVRAVKTAIDILSEPREVKYRPRNVVDAQFSIPYGVAVAFLKNRAFIEEYTDNSIRDEKTLSLAKKVRVEHDPGLDSEYPKFWPTIVEIKLKNGQRFEAKTRLCKGDPGNPLTREELEEKFRILAGKVITSRSVEKLLNSLHRLDKVQDVNELLSHLEYL